MNESDILATFIAGLLTGGFITWACRLLYDDLVGSRARAKKMWAKVQRQKKDLELQQTTAREQAELDELLHHHDGHNTIH